MRALVTGAARRLGREIALHLAGRGFDVGVHHSSSEDEAAEVAAEIERMGRRATALRADLTRADAAAGLLPRAVEALGGPVTCLVNGASIFERDDLAGALAEGLDRHMAIHLRAPLLLTQAMAAQGIEAVPGEDGEPVAAGLVINMVDAQVLAPPGPDFLTYALSKSALWDLTRRAARAAAPAIRVNAIGPGPTVRAPRQSEAHFAAMRAGTPLRRGADAGDVRAALSYLLDARTVTGQMICVDGGLHLGG